MIEVGDAYYKGNGVAKDAKKAEKWYKKAISKGNKSGYERMSKLYSGWDGLEKNPGKAMGWIVKGADEGVPELAYYIAERLSNPYDNFGATYFRGYMSDEGAKRMLIKKYYEIAAEGDNVGAIEESLRYCINSTIISTSVTTDSRGNTSTRYSYERLPEKEIKEKAAKYVAKLKELTDGKSPLIEQHYKTSFCPEEDYNDHTSQKDLMDMIAEGIERSNWDYDTFVAHKKLPDTTDEEKAANRARYEAWKAHNDGSTKGYLLNLDEADHLDNSIDVNFNYLYALANGGLNQWINSDIFGKRPLGMARSLIMFVNLSVYGDPEGVSLVDGRGMTSWYTFFTKFVKFDESNRPQGVNDWYYATLEDFWNSQEAWKLIAYPESSDHPGYLPLIKMYNFMPGLRGVEEAFKFFKIDF